MSQKYLTSPVQSENFPGGIPYIIGNEAAERFSFYGMRSILTVFMTTYLMTAAGEPDLMTGEEATSVFHWFVAGVYFFGVVGGFLSDAFWGKYRTILSLSIVYCLGHLTLALDETRFGLFAGLILIAIGSGGIKPCVSAHVGDQFGSKNKHLLTKVFGWFYFSINLGAMISTLLTPWLLEKYGPGWAFGIPGALMALATFLFWMGRNHFIHVPPQGLPQVVSSWKSADGRSALWNLSLVFLIVAMFWALFDQTGSAWVLQASRMEREILGVQLLPSQIQAINPLLILVLIPIFSYVIYPTAARFVKVTPLRKIACGMFLMIPAFSLSALIEYDITGGEVLKSTKEGDGDRFPRSFLIDGETNRSGWVSPKVKEFPEEIVIRLRERQAWTISEIRINPYVNLKSFLEKQHRKSQETEPDISDIDIQKCFAKDIEVLVSSSRVGPWKTVGNLALNQQDELQSLHLDPVETEYVMIRIKSNFGGDYVALNEIEILSPESSAPATAHPEASNVWPNVAALGHQPNIIWQLLAYLILTASEVMVSITCLEFAYTQAPKAMKSTIMALFLLSVTIGNVFTALVNLFIQNEDKSSKLEGANYYWFFSLTMLVAAGLFVIVAMNYKGKTYIQGEEESLAEAEAETEAIAD